MLIQVHGVLFHATSGTELARVRTEFLLRLPEPINKSLLKSRGPTLLCNQVESCYGKFPVIRHDLPGIGQSLSLTRHQFLLLRD